MRISYSFVMDVIEVTTPTVSDLDWKPFQMETGIAMNVLIRQLERETVSFVGRKLAVIWFIVIIALEYIILIVLLLHLIRFLVGSGIVKTATQRFQR